MLFNSYTFILGFLPVVYLVFLALQRWDNTRALIGWLVLASVFYYGWWNPKFLLLLGGSLATNAFFGKLLCREPASLPVSRRSVFITGIIFNLAVLSYFKYAGFIVENLNWGLGSAIPVPKIVLPIGISFITFQKIAFLVDAYRGEVRKFRFADFALFVAFFPQLIAGPIVHHKEVMPQFTANRVRATLADFAVGISIFAVGLFKKVVVADLCAVYADAGYSTLSSGGTLDMASAWIAILAYSFQLYYDFSGYSDMAVGLARMFGIRFPANFHSPYKATGVVEFWRRWHMTLSRFLRDYLYFPLGGNRCGRVRQQMNLMLVMLLGGLWHGAAWTFVLWGGLHGLGLIINHGWNSLSLGRSPVFNTGGMRALSVGLTFLFVTLAWIPFRAESMAVTGRMFDCLWGASADGMASFGKFFAYQLSDLDHSGDLMAWFTPKEMWPSPLPADFLLTLRPAALILFLVGVGTFLLPNSNELFARFDPVLGFEPGTLVQRWSLRLLDWRVATVLSLVFFVSLLRLSQVSPFLYYQF